MSNYHVLEMDKKKTYAIVAYHIPIPDWSNKAEPTSHSLRTALVEYLTQGGASITTQVPNLTTEFASEWSDIQSGIIYEYVVQTNFKSADWDDTQRFNKMDSKYSTYETRIKNRWKKILRLWGSNKDV